MWDAGALHSVSRCSEKKLDFKEEVVSLIVRLNTGARKRGITKVVWTTWENGVTIHWDKCHSVRSCWGGGGYMKSLVLDMLILKYKLDIQIHWAETMRICSGTLAVTAASSSRDIWVAKEDRSHFAKEEDWRLRGPSGLVWRTVLAKWQWQHLGREGKEVS